MTYDEVLLLCFAEAVACLCAKPDRLRWYRAAFCERKPRMSRVTMPDGSFEKANQMISLKDALSNLKKRYGLYSLIIAGVA